MDRLMSAIEEIRLIELGLNDEPKCQSFHDTPGNLVCSVVPTHRASHCDRGPFMVCDAWVAKVARDLSGPWRTICASCGRPTGVCWKVTRL